MEDEVAWCWPAELFEILTAAFWGRIRKGGIHFFDATGGFVHVFRLRRFALELDQALAELSDFFVF